VHLVGCIIGIYHDARFFECQIEQTLLVLELFSDKSV